MIEILDGGWPIEKWGRGRCEDQIVRILMQGACLYVCQNILLTYYFQ